MLNIKKFNKLLSNLYDLKNGYAPDLVESVSYEDSGYISAYKVYHINDEYYLKVDITDESYTECEISNISIVKEREKVITNWIEAYE